MKQLAQEVGVGLETQVDAGRRPENVILRVAEDGKYDLLVMGVLYRSTQRRLYFGPKVEQILRRAECAVAVVVSPELPEMRS